MALIQGSDITTEAVIEGFQRAVVDNILSGAYHAGNPPMCRGYQCVPIGMMDHISNVNRTPNVGSDGEIVNAATVLRGLISIVRNLTRVGTFVFTLYMRNSTGGTDYYGNVSSERSTITVEASMEGKVIFTQSEIRTELGAPANKHGVVYGETIKASNLNELFAAIYSEWAGINKTRYEGSAEICHNSCHYNCHSNCHGNCHSGCHGWTIIRND